MRFWDWFKGKFAKEFKPIVLTKEMVRLLNRQGYFYLNPDTEPKMIVTEEYAIKVMGVSNKDMRKEGYAFAFKRGLWKIPVKILHRQDILNYLDIQPTLKKLKARKEFK